MVHVSLWFRLKAVSKSFAITPGNDVITKNDNIFTVILSLPEVIQKILPVSLLEGGQVWVDKNTIILTQFENTSAVIHVEWQTLLYS